MAPLQEAALNDSLYGMPGSEAPAVRPDSSSPSPPSEAESALDTCRICRGEASDDQPLFYPCKCSGSIRYVHQECLMTWLSHSKKKYCELCKTPFRFTKLYDQSMPATLPWPLFVRQLALHSLYTLATWARYTLVAMVWLIALPWCIRQVWRGLFWLADGSWLPESQRRMREANETAVPNDVVSLVANSPADAAPSPALSVFNSFLHWLSGESLSAKVLRILFSIPPIQLGSSDSERPVKKTRPGAIHRQPSLLSEVKFVKTWTSSSLANNISIDVMEGLLICLGLVASFILVFLIREWVINQQPMLNNQDPENADNPAVAAAADEIRAQRAVRRARRRRAGIREADPVAVEPPVDFRPVRPADLLWRRALTEDNIGVPAATNQERPDLPARAQTLATPLPISDQPNGEASTLESEDGEIAPQLLRGMVGDAVDARRTLEESMISGVTGDGNDDDTSESIVANFSPLEMDAEEDLWTQGPSSEAVNNRLPTLPPDPPTDRETSGDDTHMNPGVNTVRFRDNVSIIDEDLASTEPGSALPESSESGSAPNFLTPEPSDEEVADIAPIDSSVSAGEDSLHGQDAEEAPQALTWLGQLVAFFWFVEGVPDPDLHQDLPDTERVVDQAQEALVGPFAPPANRGFAVLPEPPADDLRLQAGDLPAGLDLNDPNAIEDAEDLEGVLELIGMEGPLVGMVQNVVFSLLLISLTLAAAIWIPYIWGKIALILLANPVAVVFKAPIYLITHFVDLVADIVFFVLGLLGILFNILAKTVKSATEPIIPAYARLLDTERFEELAVNVTHQSGSRLERVLTDTVTIFSPDLPTFSMQSHRALTSFKASIGSLCASTADTLTNGYSSIVSSTWSVSGLADVVSRIASVVPQLPSYVGNWIKALLVQFRAILRPQLKPLTLENMSAQDLALVNWSTQDKIIAIVLGYIFFTVAGFLFMKLTHIFLGLKKDEKVEGPLADRLREAGGVMKVIVIIGIEMIVFPLYCGLLLDLALLPLFEGATVTSRLGFIIRAPFTGLFLHWFAGTCYMFHFALFVSMCRKILRKGVLYFIRDPDDPTFHPVRDVLERPVPTQLGKIAFSALVYGGLVIMCLGGVVWTVGRVSNVLPIRWITPEPRLAFPIDLIFFNFMLPFVLRKIKPSEKITAVYEWWYRGVAHGLRLSHFLFNDEREDEKRPRIKNGILSWYRPGAKDTQPEKEGTYVRAPASDSCRIPKNSKTFVEVTEDNKRIEPGPDPKYGLHGRKNELFTKIWLPPQFKARIATFVVLLWLFAAGTGVACTVGPLVVGRQIVKLMSGAEGHVNDLYALTLGMHLLGGAIYLATRAVPAYRWVSGKARVSLPNPVHALSHAWNTFKYAMGIAYLAVTFGLIFPFTLSLITELYIHVPLFAFFIDREKFIASAPDSADAQIVSAATTLTESASASVGVKGNLSVLFPPTIFVLQTWTLGLLYLRLVLRIAMNYPCPHSRMSTAIQLIVRDGFWRPNIWLATRAVVIPLTLLCAVLLIAPLGYAQFLVKLGGLTEAEEITRAYRFAYPGLLGLVVVALGVWNLKQRLAAWRTMVRDEVYLVGERLHNYASHAVERRDKGKGKAREHSPPPGLIEEENELPIPTTEQTEHAPPPPNVMVEGTLANDW